MASINRINSFRLSGPSLRSGGQDGFSSFKGVILSDSEQHSANGRHFFPNTIAVLDKFPVAVDVGVEMAELPEQGALGLGVVRIEFPYLGVEQVVEEERAIPGSVGRWHLRIKPAPLLGFLAGHHRPTDGLGVFEDAGLDGFVFSGCGHLD